MALEFRPETAMWTAVIIMGDPLNESAFQVSLGKRDVEVQDSRRTVRTSRSQ